MKFQIHNVGHGFCAEIRASNGSLSMIDCGSSDDWKPSEKLRGPLRLLVVSNYDHDHVQDLPGVRARLGVEFLQRNRSVTADDLRRIKLQQCGFISQPLLSMIDMMEQYREAPQIGQVSAYQPATVHPGVEFQYFWNGIKEFGDTNNLSVVTFVKMLGHTFVFGGDMEKPGWKALLRDTAFQKALAGASVFIASHHGRESGYCKEVFDHAKNIGVVVISDCEKMYETQEMTSTYAGHASGVMFNGQLRKVLTTRTDGAICWQRPDVAQAA